MNAFFIVAIRQDWIGDLKTVSHSSRVDSWTVSDYSRNIVADRLLGTQKITTMLKFLSAFGTEIRMLRN